jgi:hypothetical protein
VSVAALIVALLLLGQAAPVRPYHVVAIAALATSRHTHVEVHGRVTLVRREADGDWHVRVTDPSQPQAFVVAEIIPTFVSLLVPPPVGTCVRVRGIRRQDTMHGWPEVHPVEQLDVVACGRARRQAGPDG